MTSLTSTYTTLPPPFYRRQGPAYFPNPQLIAFNEELAQKLGLLEQLPFSQREQVFSGQKLLEGSDPIAMAYAGFQFGRPVSSLGDGRALLLGEANDHDIQLKGSGQTPFSRQGDGRSALGPVLREYLVSEAMSTLGIPTTRALAAVKTGENVLRQFGTEPGGILTRVASSHLRVGTFQYFAFKEDNENIELLLNYTLKRHYPDLLGKTSKAKALTFLEEFTRRQADLISKWYGVGFIHGVMNTDNFSLAPITIDYGPCAFMDEFSFNKVFSSIDHQGRYSYWNQTSIGKWNTLRLADCLLPLISPNQEEAIRLVEEVLGPLFPLFEENKNKVLAQKLGIKDYKNEDEKIILDFLIYLEENHLDFTLAFRHLPELLTDGHPFYQESEALTNLKKRLNDRIGHKDLTYLYKINPLYIPRNHVIQKVIDLAYQEDFSLFHQVNEALKNPFSPQEQIESLSRPPRNGEKIEKTYCGT